MRTATVVIRDRQWQVWVAASPAELVRGLAGVHIPRGTGMLLVLQLPQPATIDTRQLRFPIDIVFISQLRVVSVARNVQPGTLVTEQSPVQYVLEVNATETTGIEAGELVGITIHQSPMGIPEGFVPQLLTVGIVSAFVGGMFGGKPKGGGYEPPIPNVPWSDWRKAHEAYILVWHRALKGEEEPTVVVDYVRAHYPDDVFKQISLIGVMYELGPDYPPVEFPEEALEVARKWGVEEAVRRGLEWPEVVVGPREPPVPISFIEWIISSTVWLYYWDRYLKGKDNLAQRRVGAFVRHSDRFEEQVLYAGEMAIGGDEWAGILEEMVFLKEIEL